MNNMLDCYIWLPGELKTKNVDLFSKSEHGYVCKNFTIIKIQKRIMEANVLKM